MATSRFHSAETFINNPRTSDDVKGRPRVKRQILNWRIPREGQSDKVGRGYPMSEDAAEYFLLHSQVAHPAHTYWVEDVEVLDPDERFNISWKTGGRSIERFPFVLSRRAARHYLLGLSDAERKSRMVEEQLPKKE